MSHVTCQWNEVSKDFTDTLKSCPFQSYIEQGAFVMSWGTFFGGGGSLSYLYRGKPVIHCITGLPRRGR